MIDSTPKGQADEYSSPASQRRGPETTRLDALFAPRSIAVIGATERMGSVGRTIMENLINGPFGGPIYPVNIKAPSVLGLKAYPRLGDIPDPVDLAVIVTPAPTVPGIIRECVEIRRPWRDRDLGRLPRDWPRGRRAGAAGAGRGAARQYAR